MASANEQLQKGQIDLEAALKLLINDKSELNPDYLDQKLVKSMKADWPLKDAVPLVFANKQLFVGSPEESSPKMISSLSEKINKIPVRMIKVERKSWNSWMHGDNGANVTTDASGTRTAQLGAELAATVEEIPNRSVSATDENSIGNDVRALMIDAAKGGASDIHFEPTEKYLMVRFRVDGVLKDICKYRCTAQDDYRKIILARIKIIADLNIADTRVPQDGRVTETLDGKKVDLRVSTLPVLHGEKCVIRLLPHENSFLELTDLGMPESLIPSYEEWLRTSQGMVLITGPTGSGKTSTLYTSLAKTLDTTKNVVTVEDPVEFQLARVNQVQVNVKAGLTFAAGLRSILRQDPDIVMLGEIRDTETVEIAIQAALTGHLVLSTLHTNDAPSSINRLVDMGAQSYLISSALLGVVAQRLVRKVCKKCAEEYHPIEEELDTLGLSHDHKDKVFVRPKGCQSCNNTGYSGRDGLFEIMPVTEQMKIMIQEGAGVNDFRKLMKEMGVDSLLECGVQKILEKKTSVEEVLRVVPRESRLV